MARHEVVEVHSLYELVKVGSRFDPKSVVGLGPVSVEIKVRTGVMVPSGVRAAAQQVQSRHKPETGFKQSLPQGLL